MCKAYLYGANVIVRRDRKMRIFDTNKALFKANTEDGVRIFVNQGGTSSGKTYCIIQVLMYHAIREAQRVITVVGQDLPNLKVGALRDAKAIRAASEWLTDFFSVNESSSQLIGKNGSIIEFKSYKDEQDARNGKRDYLFVNEANGVPFPIYQQLEMRTRSAVYIDYNPSERFWVHDRVIGTTGARLIISDHRGNAFLTAAEHERIEGITDTEMWKVYARGRTGKLAGLVFPDFRIVDMMPERAAWKMSTYGLDWGYTNDPTALVQVVLAHGELWLKERIYETGLTNPMIARRCSEMGVGSSDMIIADCAEPKSIEELRATGLRVVPSQKGRDSIKSGIDIMRRYVLNVVRPSSGLLQEMKSYKWITDRGGNLTNEPIDQWNHAIDAVRYVALARLATRRRGAPRATIFREI